MKIIIKILGVLLIVVVIVVAGSLYYLDSGIKKVVETFGPDYTLTRVELADVSLSPFSGKGSLSGLAVGNPQGFSGANAFYLGEISIVVDTQTINADPVIIPSVRISAPRITFEQGKKGSNLQHLLKNIEQSTGAKNTSASSKEASESEGKKVIIKVDKKYFRPNEVEYLRGNPTKAQKKLNFKPKYSFINLVRDMIDGDLLLAQEELNNKY